MLSARRQRAVTASALAAALVLGACPAAFAASPTDRLREFFIKVNAILADPTTADRPLERVARVRRLVPEIADIGAASALVLGPEWAKKTAVERDEFVTLFTEVLERAYVGRLAGAARGAGGVVMTYGAEVVTGNEARVPTALRGIGGHDVRVEYRMRLRGGRWRVYDIVIDGVSTVENYRAQFTRLLQQGSYSALLAQLRAKLAEESMLFVRSERGAPTPVVSLSAERPAERATVAASPPEHEPSGALLESNVREMPPAVDGMPTPPAVESVAMPPPSLGSSAPPAATVTVVPRSSRAAIPTPPPLVQRKVRENRPAPPASTAKAPVAVAEPGVAAPSGVEAALGALLLGLAGAGGASFLRRRAGRSGEPGRRAAAFIARSEQAADAVVARLARLPRPRWLDRARRHRRAWTLDRTRVASRATVPAEGGSAPIPVDADRR